MDYKKLAKLYSTSQIYTLLVLIELFSTPDMINYLIHNTEGEMVQILKRRITHDILLVFNSQMTSKIP
jgi:hypothetical protein